jgi:hypothetical protein
MSSKLPATIEWEREKGVSEARMQLREQVRRMLSITP